MATVTTLRDNSEKSGKPGRSKGLACERTLANVVAALRREGMRAETMADVVRDGVRRLDEMEAQAGRAGAEDPPAVAAMRRQIGRLSREADALFKAADEYPLCGRAWVYHVCRAPGCKGVLHTARRCGLATICPACARSAAGRLRAIYTARVSAQLAGALKGIRPRLVTLALRPNASETLTDSFERCRVAGKLALRVLFGVPSSRREWAAYFLVFPVTAAELRAAAMPRAKTARRRRVRANPLRNAAGWLIASEFGERGMKAHVHALVIGRYVPQALVSKCWRLLTGSFIADIRIARDVGEVTKYPVKFIARSPDELAQLYRATAGRRRIEAFGCLRGGEDGDREALACPCCGGPVRAVGLIPAALWAMGVRIPDAEHRFRGAKPREGPT